MMSAAGNGEGLRPIRTNSCRVWGVAKLGWRGGVRSGSCHFVGGIHVPPRHLFTIFMTDGWVYWIDCKRKMYFVKFM